jgi:hypothetical protein
MTLYILGPADDLVAIERMVWNGNIRAVATAYGGGELKNVKTGVKAHVDSLSDDDLDDRDAYPLFGYRGTGELNTLYGYTTGWSHPVQGIDGRWAMKSHTHERVRELLILTLAEYPSVTEEEIDSVAFFGEGD